MATFAVNLMQIAKDDDVVRELHGIDPTAGPPPAVERVATIEA